jgi:hypothetical protein
VVAPSFRIARLRLDPTVRTERTRRSAISAFEAPFAASEPALELVDVWRKHGHTLQLGWLPEHPQKLRHDVIDPGQGWRDQGSSTRV